MRSLKLLPSPRENWDIGTRWLTGGDPLLVNRLREALALAGVIVTGAWSRRPVRPVGDEARRRLPGDEFVPKALRFTNGITLRARPGDVWPWLVQIGCDRAGVYSYDALDNGGIPSAEQILPEFQHVAVGDIVPWAPKAQDGWVVLAVEPERALVLGDDRGTLSWAFVLEPVDAATTRLIVRGRAWYESLPALLLLHLLWHPIHFGMQRRQLLGIKRRVEDTTRARARPSH